MYVSQLGDNSDGRSWQTALHTIQAALLAVPDDQGGHQVVVRPDTYMEANLYPAHRGAAGSYNRLIGDFDGRLGSGASGWVVIDSGDPQRGFKSYDWWSTIRAYQQDWSPAHQEPTFSSQGWDRWSIGRVYATGGDAGLFFDLVKRPEAFSVVVEDCVGLGRAFGGGAANFLSREDEPVVFRRSWLGCLDWWGDAGAAYVRAEHAAPPSQPDVVFTGCTLIGPDNALQTGNPGFAGYTRVRFEDCQLLALNFSQPQGTPSSGVINSKVQGSLLHVDLINSTLAGFQVFGAGEGDVSYSATGRVQAYVQFQQPVPDGFVRRGEWPGQVFASVLPPQPGAALQPTSSLARTLTKLPGTFGEKIMESTPVVFQGRTLLFHSHRVDVPQPDLTQMYLLITDHDSHQELSRFGAQHSLGSAFVDGDTLHVFAANHVENDWFHDIQHFWTTDLRNWQHELAIPRAGDEHLLNSSVCRDDRGYLMAYESNVPVSFCFKFARSQDLRQWQKIPDLVFAGVGGREYSACPVIRYFQPYYYVIYLHAAIPEHNGWVSFLARSQDLQTWQLSPLNPILEAAADEGSNNSDVDLIEIDGQTYVYYFTGDQQTWGQLKRTVYPGPMKEFFESYFTGDAPLVEVNARQSPKP